MDENDMIDLGQNYGIELPDGKESEPSYPSISYQGDKALDLPDDEFYFIGVAKRKREIVETDEEGKESHSCRIEVKAFKPLGPVEEDEADGEPEEPSALESFKADLDKARYGKK